MRRAQIATWNLQPILSRGTFVSPCSLLPREVAFFCTAIRSAAICGVQGWRDFRIRRKRCDSGPRRHWAAGLIGIGVDFDHFPRLKCYATGEGGIRSGGKVQILLPNVTIAKQGNKIEQVFAFCARFETVEGTPSGLGSRGFF